MLKLRKPRHEKHSDPELDISSLIDVSFLLLIFFLVTSTLLKRESDLAMKLPTPGEGVDPTEALQIAIAGDGRITIGGQEMAGPSDQGVASQITEVRNQLTEHRKRAELFGDQPGRPCRELIPLPKSPTRQHLYYHGTQITHKSR